MEQVLVNYDVVSEIAGHQPNRQVELLEAAEDIFGKVKNKGMQLAVKGEFKSFGTIDELQQILRYSVGEGYTIKIFDEIYGG